MSNTYQNDAENIIQHELQNLSTEEKAIWAKCMNSEAIWKGSLPGILYGGVSGYLMATFSPMKKYAKHSAVILGTFGYLVGKLMYAPYCLEKASPRLKELLRKRRFNVQSFQAQDESHETVDTTIPEYKDETVSTMDFGEPINTFDSYSSFNDSSDFSTTTETDLTEPINLQPSLSYDDLRQRNREEYQKKLKQYDKRFPIHRHLNQVPVKEKVDSESLETAVVPQEKDKYNEVWS